MNLNDYHFFRCEGGHPILEWQVSTLDELLSFRALERPDQKQFAVLGDGESVTAEMTFKEAHEWACRVAGLLARFVPERSRILLCFENGMEVIAAFFGCAYANMVPVSGVYPSSVGSRDRLFDILEDSEAVAVIGMRQTLMDFRRQSHGQATGVKWIPIEGAERAEPLYRHHATEINETALVQYTSGSVGRPRGVKITHLNLGANLSRLLKRTGFYDGGLGLSWLPLSHDMGLMVGLLIGVVAGGPCWLMLPQHFIEKPERWLKAIHRYRVGFSAGPNFAYELCARQIPDEVVAQLDLSCWCRSIIGAEMIEEDSVSCFFERFEPAGLARTVLRPGYGMAETTLMISSGGRQGHEVVSFGTFSRSALACKHVAPPQDDDDKRVLASCGKVIEGHEILIVDPENEDVLPEGEVGELWLHGPSVTPGYLNRDDENRERFGFMHGGKSFFRSRDTGFFHQGELYVTGRMENRIMLDGRVFDPDDLAHVIRVACPVFKGRSLAIFRQNDTLCVLGEIVSSFPEAQRGALMQTMARALARVCPVRSLHTVLLRSGGIRRTPSGKIRLSATCDALENAHLPLIDERTFSGRELSTVEVLERPEMKL